MMLSILKWEGWQAGMPWGYPGMQGGCEGGLEMETVTPCASPTPWDGGCDVAHTSPGDVMLTQGMSH